MESPERRAPAAGHPAPSLLRRAARVGIRSGRRFYYWAFADHRFVAVGRVLLRILPARALNWLAADFFSGRGKIDLPVRLIRAELVRQYYPKDDEERRRLNREWFWGSSPGKRWHQAKQRRYADSRTAELEYFRFRTDLLAQRVDLTASGDYHTLCEIGTGNGVYLEHLSRALPHVRRFIGIDLNHDQILENRKTFSGRRLEFIAGEVSDWISANRRDGTVFVAVGTFQYFTWAELGEFAALVRRCASPGAIALSEAVNFDLNDPAAISEPRRELAYSHNYPRLLSGAGYDFFRTQIEPIDPVKRPYDQVILTAVARPLSSNENQQAR